MTSRPIDMLCELFGIDLEYWDIWGERHEVSDETKRVLLGSMGVPLGDDGEIEAAIKAKIEEPWRRTIEPVLVVTEGNDPLRIPIVLGSVGSSDAVEWLLVEENGAEHRGAFVPQELEIESCLKLGSDVRNRFLFPLPVAPEPGYHRFSITVGKHTDEPAVHEMRLIVVPETCYIPPALQDDGRTWGPSLQLYGVRSRRNWGMGDFSDLRALVEDCSKVGAGILGVNPLHTLFPQNPHHISPYSPSTRLYLNPLYLDVEAIPEFAECAEAREMVLDPAFQARLSQMRNEEFVPYPEVQSCKWVILERLYRHFREHHRNAETERGHAFRAFQARGGENLRSYGVFEALQEHFKALDAPLWGWPVWPEEYRDPGSDAVRAFADSHWERVEFYQYLVWEAERQVAGVGQRSMECGLGVGLYQDLAVGVDGAGFETWAFQEMYALKARAGAPPDDFNLNGQDWGLPPFIPHRLREDGYELFIQILRNNMRHSGALRIDHVMGFMRLFWVPPGEKPLEGTYVRYPLEDLLGILALESRRNRCLIIGEDLGTVPDEVREALAARSVLSYRLLYFEKDETGNFKSPADYPEGALVAVSTHDLPTLLGFWNGRDIAVRMELDLFPTETLRENQIVGRAQDRARLLLALEREGLLPESLAQTDPGLVTEMTPELITAVHLYLCRTPSKVFMVQLEDLLGQLEQANLPGTVDEHPNWRRKLPLDLESIRQHQTVRETALLLRKERGLWERTGGEGRREERGVLREKIPLATYRIQLSKDFGFLQAAEILPYLQSLGITHVYASPYLRARPGSPHGYDIIDHGAINPELGSHEDYRVFLEALHRHGMYQILDMVPNHMGVGSDNQWWMDVLENGRLSNFAEFFDISWEPLKQELRNKVLLPVLGDRYGSVLEEGDLKLTFDAAGGRFSIRYHDHVFPVDPVSYPFILQWDVGRLEAWLDTSDPRYQNFRTLMDALGQLSRFDPGDADQRQARLLHQENYKLQLARLCAECPEIHRFIHENLFVFNGEKGVPRSFDLLHQLLEVQNYRLAYWRVASDEINYRRFFDINDLACLRMEDPKVFEATHQLVLELIQKGEIHGLRIDHPDGLFDPGKYFLQLQEAVGGPARMTPRKRAAAPGEEGGVVPLSLYVVVEKILADGEGLRKEWPIHGTTGYEFANLVNGLFVCRKNSRAMDRAYHRFVGKKFSFEQLAYESKKLIMKTAMAGELNVLAHLLDRISESNRHYRDFTLTNQREALTEVVACFPVYRTYVRGFDVAPEDREYVRCAIAEARARSRAEDLSIYDFIYEVLLRELKVQDSDAFQEALARFAMKVQQYTAPVMAKGIEDTAFYIYNRLVSLNEVGGEPTHFGVSIEDFHLANGARLRNWPHGMLSTSTHDSKRSEDVRARINVLSEIPEEWQARLRAWNKIMISRQKGSKEPAVPDLNDQYGIYQNLVGSFPLEGNVGDALEGYAARMERYAIKAVREAKVNSSWITPNEAYEAAVTGFVRQLLYTHGPNDFLDDFVPFCRRVAHFGMLNSLSQTLLKLTVPGVPDLYQGNEIWRHCLVDPDNRRPVDFHHRRRLLDELRRSFESHGEDRKALISSIVRNLEDGRAKLLVTWKTLALRREMTSLFQEGSYEPLDVEGSRRDHLCVFSRSHGERALIVAVPRLWVSLVGGFWENETQGEAVWQDTRILVPPGKTPQGFIHAFTQERVEAEWDGNERVLHAAAVLENFPVALLMTV